MSLDNPGLDVSGRVRARDVQTAAVADVRRRVLMVSGAVDVRDHDVSMCLYLPEPGRWQVIKSEANLTGDTWLAMQVTTDDDTIIISDDETMTMSRQFGRSFATPDGRRLTFYDGEVRPGEAVLKVFTIETSTRHPTYAHSRYGVAGMDDDPAQTAAIVDELVVEGLPQRPAVELFVPVTVIG